MLRILILATEWESRHGGLSSFNRTFCRFLAADGCEVYCYLPKTPSAKEQEEADSLSVRLVGPRDSFQSDALGEKYLLCFPPNIPIDLEIDWIIGHGHVTGPAALVQKLNSFPRARLAHVVHVAPGTTEWFKGDEEGSSAAAKAENRERLELDIATKADLVIAVGPLLKREIANLLNGETHKIYQLNPGLNFTGSSLRTPPEGEHCLFLGRAEDYRLKGLDIAMRAFALATDGRTPRPVFVVRGAEVNSSNILRKRLASWSRTHGCDIRVREYSPNADLLWNDLHRSTMLMMPSRAEGFGLVALEALGAGVPFLASMNSGFAELIREKFDDKFNDFLLPVVDDQEIDAAVWSKAIGQIIEAPHQAFRRIHSLREEYSRTIRWDDGVRGLIETMEHLKKSETKKETKKDTVNHTSNIAIAPPPAPSAFRRNAGTRSSRRYDCNLKWKSRVGIGARTNKPVLAGDVLLVPTCGGAWNKEDAADGVYVIEKRSGKIRSHIKTKGDANAIDFTGGIFVVGSDSGHVVCAEIDTGRTQWEVNLDSSVLSKPKIKNNHVIVATIGGDIVALSLNDGSTLNRISMPSGYATDPIYRKEQLLYPTIDGCIVAIDPEAFVEGRQITCERIPFFFRDIHSDTGVSSCEFWATPCVLGEVIVMPYARGTLYEGLPVMGIDLDSLTPIWDSPALTSEYERLYGNVRSSPCAFNDLAVMPLTYGNQISAIDSMGTIKWIAECGYPYFEQYGSPEICGDLVLVPRFDGFVHAIEAESGEAAWSLRFEEDSARTPILDVSDAGTSWENSEGIPLNSPLAVDGSHFYVLGSNGILCCYEVQEDLDA